LRSTAKGFVPMRAAGNILISFSTKPGQVAQDANIFSSALANQLRQPGLPPYSVFKRTQLAVNRLTRGRQVPWQEDGLLVEGFYFKAPPQDPTRKKTPPPGTSFRDCDEVCPEMVVVPAGSFTMGSPPNEKNRGDDEGPQRRVTIAKPFAAGKYEVTFAEWDACVADGGCSHKPEDEGWGRGKRPVINVSWDDVTKQYLPWLSRKTGHTYRLLTEAEWEYVARAGTTTAFWWGNSFDRSRANKNVSKSVPVGAYDANAFGLHDTQGNVWEWVQDCYDAKAYRTAPTNGAPVPDKSNCSRVVRGGSWINGSGKLRAASRNWNGPVNRSILLGFRVARVLFPARTP